MTGASAAMRPQPDANFEQRIRFENIFLSDGTDTVKCHNVDAAITQVKAQATGRLLVRGSNGSGKSTLLVALKARLGSSAFYWPTSDKLAFAFLSGRAASDEAEGEMPLHHGYSSGERQLKCLKEIVNRTQASVYLLDEWDANLDSKNRAAAEALVAQLAARAVVIEISHRDRL